MRKAEVDYLGFVRIRIKTQKELWSNLSEF